MVSEKLHANTDIEEYMGLLKEIMRGNFSKVNVVAASTVVVSLILDFTIESALC